MKPLTMRIFLSMLVLALAGSTVLTRGQKSGQPVKPPPAEQGRPDLVPVLPRPMDGHVVVKNIGIGPAGPSKLTLDCQKAGAPSKAGCPDLPPSAAATYFDPMFPKNATISVPALGPGASFEHSLSFWGEFKWPKGTYRFTAVADAGHALLESNKKNNTAYSTLIVQ
jgi:hypothetical protein